MRSGVSAVTCSLVWLSLFRALHGLVSSKPERKKWEFRNNGLLRKKATWKHGSMADNVFLKSQRRHLHFKDAAHRMPTKERLDLIASASDAAHRVANCTSWAPRKVATTITGPRIPQQLLLTGHHESLSRMHPAVQSNIRNISNANPAISIRWLGDKACLQYLEKYFDEELAGMFRNEMHGSYRGDICRTAVLLREGGFYMDLDVQLVLPLNELIDDATSFMSVYEDPAVKSGGMLNALLAAEANSAILNATLIEIRRWYQGKVEKHGWLGPVTLMRGINQVVKTDCPCTSLGHLKVIFQRPTADPQWQCGSHTFRTMVQRDLLCSHPYSETECREEQRWQSHEYAVHKGLFFPGQDRRIIGWPRPAWCIKSGCGFGGADNHNMTDDSPV